MLQVTPVEDQIEVTVRTTLKMFKGELGAHDIRMNFEVDESYREAKIDWVFCDPARVKQVFINLLSNVSPGQHLDSNILTSLQAIKFTRSEEKREIAVRLGASFIPPPDGPLPGIQWFHSKEMESETDLTLGTDWGTGEQVYLYFTISDTGRGLSADETKVLFHRFSQASPKTHVSIASVL